MQHWLGQSTGCPFQMGIHCSVSHRACLILSGQLRPWHQVAASDRHAQTCCHHSLLPSCLDHPPSLSPDLCLFCVSPVKTPAGQYPEREGSPRQWKGVFILDSTKETLLWKEWMGFLECLNILRWRIARGPGIHLPPISVTPVSYPDSRALMVVRRGGGAAGVEGLVTTSSKMNSLTKPQTVPWSHYLTPVKIATIEKINKNKITSIGEDMEKLELVNCWKECKMVQPLWRAVWQVLRKWNTELPYDPVIPLLGIYLQRIARRNSEICTSMFTAKLLTIDERWKQPKCAVTDEWLNRMWHILTIEYYSALKR